MSEEHAPDQQNEPDEPQLTEDEVAEGEEIAVPAGDITGAIVSTIEGHRESDDKRDG